MAGDDARVRKCIGCMNCFKMASMGRAIECAVNPVLGRETYRGEDKLVKNGNGKKVAVIGGGPAGMEAAIVLAKRGFKPVLIEKSGALGGTMNLADKAPSKELITELTETMSLELNDLDVQVLLNTEGTVEKCKELGVEGVILARGGLKNAPAVPGIE